MKGIDKMIEIQNVTKRFDGNIVIDDISLVIPKNQLIGILGPSGCGKTTLLKCLMGMLPTTEGSIHVLKKLVPHKDLLKNIGYMAQSDALYQDLTGKENLMFFASMYRMPLEQKIQHIQYVTQLVNLEDSIDKLVETYSGGMKRRLSLAISLLHQPDLLILDEPTVGIDPKIKKQVWQELRKLNQVEGKSILMTTHAMDEVEQCDQAILLYNGKVLAFDTPSNILATYGVSHFDEVFIQLGGNTK